jgi:hypothetical protein
VGETGLVTRDLQYLSQRLGRIVVVVDDQNAQAAGRGPRPGGVRLRGTTTLSFTGRRTTNSPPGQHRLLQ